MTIDLYLPRALADLAAGKTHLTITTAGETRLAEVLAVVAGEYPALGRRMIDETGALRRFVNVYVDGEECRGLAGLSTPVTASCVIHVLGSIAGG